jgi:hypothetical protein
MRKRDVDAFKKRMSKIKMPEGFTGTFGEEKWPPGNETYHHFELVKENDTKIKFDLSGCGHTSFMVGDGWRSFDRTGVEDSFYHTKVYKGDDRVIDLDTIIAEQLKRIAERREYYKSAVEVPGLPAKFTVAPDGVAGLKASIKNNGHLSFTPSGFGVGYCVTKRPQQGLRYGEVRAKPELEKFLDHSPLYVHTLDCD